MKFSLFHPQDRPYRRPQPATMPDLPNAHFFALYRGARSGGDFYDFACVDGRVLTLFCDISGKRDEALHIAAAVQDAFQEHVPMLFSGADINESDRLSELLLIINRRILEAAKGPRYTPAFVSCFDPELGTLTYVNAGHLPALMRDGDGISTLDASGLPLGLFTHSTHDSQVSVLRPGSSLLLVSRGLIETKRHHEEFGIDRVKESLLSAQFENARELCAAMQAAAQRFLENKLPDNDLTTLAMVRPQAAAQGMTA
jgi:serine phosphatase RsbU (regulator of sigma subunit)